MLVLLNLTSIHDLLNSLNKMAVYDRMLSELKITSFNNFVDENNALNAVGSPYTEALQLLPDIEQHRTYSKNPEI